MLTEAAAATVASVSRLVVAGLTLANAVLLTFLFRDAAPRFARRIIIVFKGLGLAWLLPYAYLGFAVGLSVAVRAGVTAYILASTLALLWVGLMQLRPSPRTLPIFALLTLAALSLSVWQLLQPRLPYALIGTAEGTIGITAGTPAQIVVTVRNGLYPGAPDADPLADRGSARRDGQPRHHDACP